MDLHQGFEEEGDEVVLSLVRGDWDWGERVREVWNWEENRRGERSLEEEEEEFRRRSVVAIDAEKVKVGE